MAQFTKEELRLMLRIIKNLDIYVSDDDMYEMRENMIEAGHINFESDCDRLQIKIKALCKE